MKTALAAACRLTDMKADFEKLHACIWMCHALEKLVMNAEKLFEVTVMQNRHTKGDDEAGCQTLQDVTNLKEKMANYHGAMHANLKELEKLEDRMKQRQGGAAHERAVKDLHAEYSIAFEGMKATLLEQYPVEIEGAVQGLRDKNEAALEKYGWSEASAGSGYAGSVKCSTMQSMVEAPQDSLRCSTLGGWREA